MSKEKSGSTATIQSEVVEVTQAEIDAFQATAFQEGASAERERITQIHKDANTLNITGEVVQTLIENGSSADQAKTMLFAVREGIDNSTSIHTSHEGDGDDEEIKNSGRLLSNYRKVVGAKK